MRKAAASGAARPGSALKLRVPADDMLEQCYRFRCIVDPAFAQQMATFSKNVASLPTGPQWGASH